MLRWIVTNTFIGPTWTSCAVPIPKGNFASLGVKDGLADFEKQVAASLAGLKDRPEPKLFIFIGSHGLPGKLCQQGKPDIDHKDILFSIFTKVSSFEEHEKKSVKVELVYDACHAAGIAEAAKHFLEDKDGKYRGSEGKSYRHRLDVFAASGAERKAFGNDLMDSIKVISARNRSCNRDGDLFCLEDAVPLCARGQVSSGRHAIFSTDVDLADIALIGLENSREPLTGVIWDWTVSAPGQRDKNLEAAKPAIALRVLGDYQDPAKKCAYLERLVKILEDKSTEKAMCGDTAEQKSRMAAMLHSTLVNLDSSCVLKDGGPTTLSDRLLAWLSNDQTPGCYQSIALKYLKRETRGLQTRLVLPLLARFLGRSEFRDDAAEILENLSGNGEQIEALALDPKTKTETRFGILANPALLKHSANKPKLYTVAKELWEQHRLAWNPKNEDLDSLIRSLVYFGSTPDDKDFGRNAFLKLYDGLDGLDRARNVRLFLKSGNGSNVLFPDMKFDLLSERSKLFDQLRHLDQLESDPKYRDKPSLESFFSGERAVVYIKLVANTGELGGTDFYLEDREKRKAKLQAK